MTKTERVFQAVKMLLDGGHIATCAAVAEIVGITEKRASALLGVLSRQGKLVNPGQCGPGRSPGYRLPVEYGHEDLIQAIARLRDRGTCPIVRTLAHEFGITHSQVKYRLDKARGLGLIAYDHKSKGYVVLSDPSVGQFGGEHRKPAPERRYKPKVRKCLMCRSEFKSSWPGERVCRNCKGNEAWKSAGLI